MQEGYNSNANQIFSLLHQINNLFIMQLLLWTFFFPTPQSFNVPISFSIIRDDDNNSDDPQHKGDLSHPLN